MRVHTDIIQESAAGAKSYTACPFQPNLLLMWSVGHPTAGAVQTTRRFSMSAAVSAAAQKCAYLTSADAANPTDTGCTTADAIYLIAAATAGPITSKASFVAFTATGFDYTIDLTDGFGRQIVVMLIDVPNPKVGVIASPLVPGTVTTTIGSEARCGMLFGPSLPTHPYAMAKVDTQWSMGLFDDALTQVVCAHFFKDGVATAIAKSRQDAGAVWHAIDAAGATVVKADVDLVTPTAFRLNFTAVDVVARQMIYAVWDAPTSHVETASPTPAAPATVDFTTAGAYTQGLLSMSVGAAALATPTADAVLSLGGVGDVPTEIASTVRAPDAVIAGAQYRKLTVNSYLQLLTATGAISHGAVYDQTLPTGYRATFGNASGVLLHAWLSFAELVTEPPIYRDYIQRINQANPWDTLAGPTHYWTCDGVGTDLGRGLNRAMTGVAFSGGTAAFNGAPLAADSGFSLATVGAGYGVVADSNDINLLLNMYQQRSWSFWCSTSNVDLPRVLFKEGGGVNNFAVGVGVGGLIWAQVASVGDYFLIQFTDFVMRPGISYHFVMEWERGAASNGNTHTLRFYVNGVQQTDGVTATAAGTNAFPAHSGDLAFGNDSADTFGIGLKFINESNLIFASIDKRVSHYAIWNDYLLTPTERSLLFAKGAILSDAILTLTQVEADATRSLNEITALGGTVIGLLAPSVVRDPASGIVFFDYSITTTEFARVRVIKYGRTRFETDIELTRFDAMVPTFVEADPFITEPNAAVTRAKTVVATLDDLYDIGMAWDEDFPDDGDNTFVASGSQLNSDHSLVVFDPAAPVVFDEVAGVMTVKITGGTPSTAKFNALGIPTQFNAVTSIVDFAVNAAVTLNAAGTYTWDNVHVGDVNNTSGGPVVLNLLNGSTIGANLGPNITVNSVIQVTAPALIDGTVVELYDVTAAVLLDFSTVAGGAGYVNAAVPASAVGHTVSLRAVYHSGLNYMEQIEAFATPTVGGASFPQTQTPWVEMESFGIDGSLVTEFTTDFVNVQVDISDPDGITQKGRLITWWAAAVPTTAQGMRDFFGAFQSLDAANWQVDAAMVNLKLDNVNPPPSPPVIFNDPSIHLFMSDGTTLIATTSNSIQIDQGKVFIGAAADLWGVPQASGTAVANSMGELLDDAATDAATAKALVASK